MGKLIVHTGHAQAIIREDIEVLGSILSTSAEMSSLGYDLKPSKEILARQVFTNCDHVINGLRLAVKMKLVDCRKVEIRFHHHNSPIKPPIVIHIDSDGNFDRAPLGFMDQAGIDLLKLL